MPTKQVAVRMPKDLLLKLSKDAKQERVSASDVIRKILLKYYGMLNGNQSAR